MTFARCVLRASSQPDRQTASKRGAEGSNSAKVAFCKFALEIKGPAGEAKTPKRNLSHLEREKPLQKLATLPGERVATFGTPRQAAAHLARVMCQGPLTRKFDGIRFCWLTCEGAAPPTTPPTVPQCWLGPPKARLLERRPRGTAACWTSSRFRRGISSTGPPRGLQQRGAGAASL